MLLVNVRVLYLYPWKATPMYFTRDSPLSKSGQLARFGQLLWLAEKNSHTLMGQQHKIYHVYYLDHCQFLQ